ncbi:response regulator [Cohnella yongneupensis]|uniref:Response regulator n=1 Tax=Cohnella yongneupensis TaxID=425006 RepID=A0ABW0QYS8_9BACL
MKTQLLIIADADSDTDATAQSIQAEPDMEVAALVAPGAKAIERIWQQPVHLALLDSSMPVMKGISYIQSIRKIAPPLPILIMTSHSDEESIVQYLAHGANAYLIRNQHFSKLTQSIRDVLKGQHVLPDNVAAKLSQYLLRQLNSNSTPSKQQLPSHLMKEFSEREKQVIDLLIQRYSNQEIAEALFLSEGTVRNYLTHIFSKIPVNNRREAIRVLNQRFTVVQYPTAK